MWINFNKGIVFAALTSLTPFGFQGSSTTIYLVLLDNISYPFSTFPISALTSEHLHIQIHLVRTPNLRYFYSNFSIDLHANNQILNNSPSPFDVLNSIDNIESIVANLTDSIKNCRGCKMSLSYSKLSRTSKKLK